MNIMLAFIFESEQANVSRVAESPCPLQMASGKRQKENKDKKVEIRKKITFD